MTISKPRKRKVTVKSRKNPELNFKLLNSTLKDPDNQVLLLTRLKKEKHREVTFYGKLVLLKEDIFMVSGNDGHSRITFDKSEINEIFISLNPRYDIGVILKE